MLLYIPIMAVILITNGQSITGASYYSLVVMVGEGVTYIAKNIVSPLLSVFLGLSVTSAISSDLNMQGIINGISKIIKWIIGFAMTGFLRFTNLQNFNYHISRFNFHQSSKVYFIIIYSNSRFSFIRSI